MLTALFGTEAIPGTTITLEFRETELGGFAGCNSYGAPYTATSQGSLEVTEVEMTTEGCGEPEGVLVQEGVFEQALLSAVGYEQSPGTFIFIDDAGRAVLEFVTPQQVPDPTEVPEPDISQLWVEAIDERTGLRFAVPCFWEVNIPSGEQDPSRMGSFNVRNYDMAFVQAHPRGSISEDEGAVKIDFIYIAPSGLGLSPGVGLAEFAQTLAGPEGESGIEAVEPVTVNSHDALNVAQQGAFGLGYFTVVALEEDLYLLFGGSAFASNDVQGVLQSIVYGPDVSVNIPSLDPGNPPLGMEAPCMGQQSGSSTEDLGGDLDLRECSLGFSGRPSLPSAGGASLQRYASPTKLHGRPLHNRVQGLGGRLGESRRYDP